MVEQQEQVEGLHVRVRSCAQVQYKNSCVQAVCMSVQLCVNVRACECIGLSRGAQVQRREICSIGRVDGANA